MDDAEGVRAFEGIGNLPCMGNRLLYRQRSLRDAVGQRRPLYQFHDKGVNVAGLLKAVDGSDVRMIERGQHLSLTLEAGEALRILGVYRQFMEEWIALPVVTGLKSESEKFAGAVETYTLEAMMQDRRALQAGIGIVLSARLIPGFFLAPVAGVLVDRWNRKRLMVACDVGRGITFAFLPWIDTIVGLVLVSLFLELLTMLWAPAKEASVPSLVRPQYLTTANSLSLFAAYGTFPVGTALFAALAGVAKWLAGLDVAENQRPHLLLDSCPSPLRDVDCGAPDDDHQERQQSRGGEDDRGV